MAKKFKIVDNQGFTPASEHLDEIKGNEPVNPTDPPKAKKFKIVDTSFHAKRDNIVEGLDTEDYTQYLGEDVYAPTGGIEAMNKQRAEMQPWMHQARNMVGQAVVGEIIGGTIEGLGYLLEMPNMMSYSDGTEQDWGNWITDAGKNMREGMSEAAPIHQTDPGAFNPSDSGWWFGNGVSVASSLSMLVPSMAGAKALSLLGKTASKGLGAIHKSLDIAKKMGKQSNWMTSGITQAVVSRHIENSMEASGTFSDQRAKLLGTVNPKTGVEFTDEEATRLASEAASSNYRSGWAMLLQDIPQYLAIGKIFNPKTMKMENAMSKLAKTGRAPKIAGYAKAGGATFLSEGFEESYQYFVAERGKLLSDLKAGLIDEKEYEDKLYDKIGDEEMMSSAFWGGLGGNLFQAAGPATNDLFKSKESRSREKNYAAATGDFLKQRGAQFVEMQKILSDADQSSDPIRREEAANGLLFNLTLDHVDVDKFDTHIESLNNMLHMSQEEKAGFAEQGIELNEDLMKAYIPKAIEQAHEIRADYLKNSNKNDSNIAKAMTRNNFNAKAFKKKKEALSKERSDIRNNVIGVGQVTSYKQELFDFGTKLQALKNVAKLQEKRMNETSSEKKKTAIKSLLETNKREQARIASKISKAKANDFRNAEQKDTDNKYFDGFNASKQEVIDKQSAEELFDNELILLAKENKMLKSESYQKEFKKKQYESDVEQLKTEEGIDIAKENIKDNEDFTAAEKEEITKSLDEKKKKIQANKIAEEFKLAEQLAKDKLAEELRQKNEENSPSTPNENNQEINEIIEDEYANEDVQPSVVDSEIKETIKDEKVNSGSDIRILDRIASPLFKEWIANGKDKIGTKVEYVIGDAVNKEASKAIADFRSGNITDHTYNHLPLKVIVNDNENIYSFVSSFTPNNTAFEKKDLPERIGVIKTLSSGNKAVSEISAQYGGNLQLDYSNPEAGIPENNILELSPVSGMDYIKKNLLFTDERGRFNNLSKKTQGKYGRATLNNSTDKNGNPVPYKGGVFLVVPKMDGHPFPLKLNMRRTSANEASLITKLIGNIVKDKIALNMKMDDLPGDIINELKANHQEFLGSLANANPNVSEIIGALVHFDEKTKGKDAEFYFKDGSVKFGNTPAGTITADNFEQNSEALMDFLTNKKSRHVQITRFNKDKKYRDYIVESGILNTDAVVNKPLFNSEATMGQSKRKSDIYIKPIGQVKIENAKSSKENNSLPLGNKAEIIGRMEKTANEGPFKDDFNPRMWNLTYYGPEGKTVTHEGPNKEALLNKVRGLYKTELANTKETTVATNDQELSKSTTKSEAKPVGKNSEIELTSEASIDKKGRVFTYFENTRTKGGIEETTYNFNRSDKDASQRNPTGVKPEIALNNKGYKVKEESIPEGTTISKVYETRVDKNDRNKAWATVEFINEDGDAFRGEVKLESTKQSNDTQERDLEREREAIINKYTPNKLYTEEGYLDDLSPLKKGATKKFTNRIVSDHYGGVKIGTQNQAAIEVDAVSVGSFYGYNFFAYKNNRGYVVFEENSGLDIGLRDNITNQKDLKEATQELLDSKKDQISTAVDSAKSAVKSMNNELNKLNEVKKKDVSLKEDIKKVENNVLQDMIESGGFEETNMFTEKAPVSKTQTEKLDLSGFDDLGPMFGDSKKIDKNCK